MKLIFPILIVLTVSVIFLSCGDSGNKTSTGDSNKNSSALETKNSSDKKDQINSGSQSDEPKSKSVGDGIPVHFPPGATQITIAGEIKGLSDNIPYVFEAKEGQTLMASLKTANDKANIRFNQIFDPSGNADGPFSNQMTYKLNQSGVWKLIVGESNMLGEPYTGEFDVTIDIK